VGEIATERPAAALPPGCGQCTVGQYCVHDTRWTWQPGYVPGAQRGDLVFYARQQSVVQAMLPTACPLCYFEQERHGHPDPPFTWREHKLN